MIRDRLRSVTPKSQNNTLADFVTPNAQCPVCGAAVFFIRPQNGGNLWLDSMGPPWPKHPCMDVLAGPQTTRDPIRSYRPQRLVARAFDWLSAGWSPLVITDVIDDDLVGRDPRTIGQRVTADELRFGRNLELTFAAPVPVQPGDVAHWIDFDHDGFTRVSFLDHANGPAAARGVDAWDHQRYRFVSSEIINEVRRLASTDRTLRAIQLALAEDGRHFDGSQDVPRNVTDAINPYRNGWRGDDDVKRAMLETARATIPDNAPAGLQSVVFAILVAFS